jgi:syntaxin 18
MLANIRKPYLNVDSRNPQLSRHSSSRTIDLAGPDQSWSGIRSLTNEERDQIDFQARVILSRCADRVKEMEILEKRTFIFSILPQTSTSLLFTVASQDALSWKLTRRIQLPDSSPHDYGKMPQQRPQTL